MPRPVSPPNPRRRYKALPLPDWLARKYPGWEECFRGEPELAPVFGRPGYYYDRHERVAWMEFDGRARRYGTPAVFAYALAVNEGDNLPDPEVVAALGVLARARPRILTRAQLNLLWNLRDRQDIRATYRDGLRYGL